MGTEIYELRGNREQYGLLALKDERQSRTLMKLAWNELRPGRWWPLPCEFVVDPDRSVPDIADLNAVTIAMTDEAISRLQPTIGEYCDLFPIDVDGADYYLLKIRNCIDALDDGRCIGLRADHRMRFVYADRIAFLHETVRSHELFSLKRGDPFAVFVNQRFLRRLQVSGLSGWHCTLVWEFDQSSQDGRSHPRDGLNAIVVKDGELS